MFVAIIKPTPAKTLAVLIRAEDRARCSRHRAVLVLDDSEDDQWLVEEVKTGLQYPASPKSIISVKRATKEQLAEAA